MTNNIYVYMINNICVYMTMKKLSEETGQKIVNPNTIEVITFLNQHRSAILFKIYLYGTIAIFRLPRVMSKGRLREGI